MKAENLMRLRNSGINVPMFCVIDAAEENRGDIDLSFSKKEYFAVRSSCALEDSDTRSHAGEFQTLLHVKREEIDSAVDTVLSGYGEERAGHVIIQEMVDSDISGILFTANPLGILNEYCIVAGKGLGDRVVDNRIDTTTYHYNRDDQTYITVRGGKDTVLFPETRIGELVSLGEKIETLFHKKMDIEFAIEKDEIFILQARPITTLCQGGEEIILDNSNIVESYPGVSLPLTQSFVKDIYYRIFRNCLLRMTGNKRMVRDMDDLLRDMVDTVNGRIYYRISNWYTILKLLPFSAGLIRIWQKMMGLRNHSVRYRDSKVGPGTKLTICIRFIKYLLTAPCEMDRLNACFEKTLAGYRAIYEKAESIEQLYAVYMEAKEGFLADWDITLVNDMYTFLYTGLAGAGEKGGKKGETLIAEIHDLESMKPVRALERLENIYAEQGEESPEFKTALEEYIESYGDRTLEELKLETKTYRTHPELLTEYIKTGAGSVKDSSRQNGKPGRDRAGRKNLAENVCGDRNNGDGCAKTASRGKEKRGIFVRNARTGIYNREISRMNRSRLFGFTRDIFLKIGRILTDSGKLEQADDIFYLYDHEIPACADMDGRQIRALVEERRRQYDHYRNLPGFGRLVFDGRVLHELNYLGSAGSLRAEGLQGTGISEGIAEGEALVMDRPDMRADTAGKILITRSTDPGWVFLIRSSLGVVAEQGSLLSHTAIISRELKKPAIVNVKNAMALIRSGDRIRIDGLTGTIKIRKEN